jgi:taurine dioxygenase
MQITPLTGVIGAEVSEVDLAAALPPDVVAEIDRALRDYKVVVFRDQLAIRPRDLLALAEHFGQPEVERHSTHASFPDVPAVKILVTDGGGFHGRVEDSWHTDGSPRKDTNWTSFLQAIEVPPFGRDTLFADMEAAYVGLSAATRAYVDSLVAVHSWGRQDPDKPPVEHPVVHTDPRTGRKSLYVNRGYTRSIVGMKTDESRALLDFLFLQAHMPEYQLRVTWKPGSIVAWDNQRTQHYVVQDRAYRRVMHRVMVFRS